MKLTAEQKQLLHECVDLSIEVNWVVHHTHVTIRQEGNSAYVEILIYNWRDDFDKRYSYTDEQLQQAKDYLTKLLEN